MAVRTPVYWNRNNARIEQMGSSDIQNIIDHAIYLYASSPSVVLGTDPNWTNLGTITDTRLIAGAYKSNASDYVSESDTPNVSTTSVSYNYLHQNRASVDDVDDTSYRTFPLFYNSDGNLQSMSYEDMLDTFIHPAITHIAADNDASNVSQRRGGTFKISADAIEEDHTYVAHIFTDTRANPKAYTASSIPEALDQSKIIRSYYLHRRNGDDVSFTLPMRTRADDDLEVYTRSIFDDMLSNMIRYNAANSTAGYKLDYNINGSGVQKGGAVKDTRLDGSSYKKRFVNADDYRTQKFPAGSAYVVSNYYLKLNLI